MPINKFLYFPVGIALYTIFDSPAKQGITYIDINGKVFTDSFRGSFGLRILYNISTRMYNTVYIRILNKPDNGWNNEELTLMIKDKKP